MAKTRRAFWAHSHLGFSPRVRAIAKEWDPFFNCWRIVCRVTGRDQAHQYHGYRTGAEYAFRASMLYGSRRVIRGSCGRLEYFDFISGADIDALPIREGTSND
jgi:hypothetical protein